MRSVSATLAARIQAKDFNVKDASNSILAAIKAIGGISNISNFKAKVIELLKTSYDVNGFGLFLPDDTDFTQTAEMIVNYCSKDGEIVASQVRTIQNVFTEVNKAFTPLTSE